MKVTKWNSIKHLNSEESRNAYMNEMMIDSNPKLPRPRKQSIVLKHIIRNPAVLQQRAKGNYSYLSANEIRNEDRAV